MAIYLRRHIEQALPFALHGHSATCISDQLPWQTATIQGSLEIFAIAQTDNHIAMPPVREHLCCLGQGHRGSQITRRSLLPWLLPFESVALFFYSLVLRFPIRRLLPSLNLLTGTAVHWDTQDAFYLCYTKVVSFDVFLHISSNARTSGVTFSRNSLIDDCTWKSSDLPKLWRACCRSNPLCSIPPS